MREAWLPLLIALGTINAGMLAAASLAWGYVLRKADSIDDLLRTSAHRDRVAGIVHGALAARWQVLPSAALALVPWAHLMTASPPVGTGETTVALAINATWTLAILGNVSYWLAISPLTIISVARRQDLALRWNDPARTPGIRTFSEGFAYAALFLALGAAAITLPGIAGMPLFGAYLPYLYLLVITLSLWVGVVTQVIIYALIRRYRLRMLDSLAGPDLQLVERSAASLLPGVNSVLSDRLTIYSSIANAPGLPYGSVVLIQYAAAVVGSVAGLLLQ